ncbi:hypothetical protein VARIO8X_70102 [Burkholderiales bacterium 8X]|nr:hypothetical protein VARIO8X_70102 [Burkholderiales bacterium 8X]
MRRLSAFRLLAGIAPVNHLRADRGLPNEET